MRQSWWAALVAVLLALAGCAHEPAADATVAVAGELGSAPLVTFATPYPLAEQSVEVVVTGDGPALGTGDVALLLVSGFAGDDGRSLGEVARPRVVELNESSTDLYDALVGVTVGSRVVITRPVSSDTSDYMEIVVIDVMPLTVTGMDVTAVQLPEGIEVTEDAASVPSVMVDGAAEPETLGVYALVKGSGAQVLPNDTVYGQYTVWAWDDGSIYDSTWQEGGAPAAVDLSDAWEGLADGLADQTVGSRLLLLIPPDLGIGSDSLLVVFDILAREAGS